RAPLQTDGGTSAAISGIPESPTRCCRERLADAAPPMSWWFFRKLDHLARPQNRRLERLPGRHCADPFTYSRKIGVTLNRDPCHCEDDVPANHDFLSVDGRDSVPALKPHVPSGRFLGDDTHE